MVYPVGLYLDFATNFCTLCFRSLIFLLLFIHLAVNISYTLLNPCTSVIGCVCSNGTKDREILCNLRENKTFDFQFINFKNISYVEIYGNNVFLNGNTLPVTYPEVKKLKIQGSKIRTVLTLNFLVQFPNIQDLTIKKSNVIDIQAGAFRDLRFLKSLDLSENRNIAFGIVEKGLQQLNSPNLRILNLSLIHNKLEHDSGTLPTGRISYNMFKLLANTNLEVLDVSWTRLYIFEASASYIPGLRSLNFSGTAVIGSTECLLTFLSIGNLTEIIFDYWPFTGRIDELPFYQKPRYKYSANQCGGKPIPIQDGCYKFPNSIETLQAQNLKLSAFFIDFSQEVCLDAKGLKKWLVAGLALQKPFAPIHGITNIRIFDLSNPDFLNAQSYFASIDCMMFHKMPSLEVVLLPGNRLNAMADSQLNDLFCKNSALRMVDLSYNSLKSLPTNLFVNNSLLFHLNLSRNELTTIEFKVRHLVHLEVLDVSYNKMKVLGKPITDIIDISFNSLMLFLKHNDFRCDCSINNIISMNISMLQMSCRGKFGNEIIIKNNTLSNLHPKKCIQDTKAVSRTVLIIAILGPLSGIILIVLGILFKKRIFIRKKRKPLVFFYQKSNAGHLERNRRFKAFLAFSHSDEEIVFNELVPKLESLLGELFTAENSDLLCIYDKHFIPGQPIDEVCEQAVLNSYVVIAVLSKAFMESSWCDFEIKRAYECSIKIIPLYLEDCDHCEYKGIFKAMFDEVIRLKWPHNGSNKNKEDVIKKIADAVYAYVKCQEIKTRNNT